MNFPWSRLVSGLVLAPMALWLAGCGSTSNQVASASAFRAFVAPQTLRSDEATLLWDKVEASAGASVTYAVLRDGRQIGTTTKTHFTARDLAPEQSYTFTIVATGAGAAARRSVGVPVRTKAKETVLSIESFGALGDGVTLNTKAIQAAIDACPANGVVLIPRGVFLSGALFLKSDMTLEIAADGVLQGSTALADYEPFYRNRFEGWELDTYASLLNAGRMDHAAPANVRNLSIRGAGKIAGGGEALGKAMIEAHGMRSRGRLICLMNCANVELQGLTIEQPPCWTVHYLYCEDVTCLDLHIITRVRNGDGIDPDSSRNSYIVHCTFDTGDDCIAIKSGKNPEGNVVNRPTENVVVTDCRFVDGHGISIGSEMSGGVRNVLVEDCVAGALLNGLQIKGTKERGGFVENVTVRNCDLQKITVFTKLNYNNDGQAAAEPPIFRNFKFENIDLRHAKPGSPIIVVNGFDDGAHRTHQVSFDGVQLPAGAKIEIDQTEDVSFRRVTTADGSKPTVAVTRSDRVTGLE